MYVEAAETQKDVTVSKVQVKDLSGDNVITEDEQNLSVSAAAKRPLIHLMVLKELRRVIQQQEMHCIAWQKQKV